MIIARTAHRGPPRVLTLVPRGSAAACAWWRALRPITLLEKAGYPAAWDYFDNPRVVDVIGAFDAICWQRAGWADPADGRALVDGLHRAGVLAWQEVDDDMWWSRGEQKSHAEMGLSEPELTPEQNRASTAIYDGVIVSSERLRTAVMAFLPDMPCAVVQNFIDLAFWRRALSGYERAPELRGRVTVGWFGGNRRAGDLEVVAEAWRRVARARRHVRFVVQGYVDPGLAEAVPRDRLHVVEWLPAWPQGGRPFYGVGLLNMDIICAAVRESTFNSHKTPIKFLEATAAGSAVVVSEWLYGSVVTHGETGYVCRTADDWEEAILTLVDNPARRRRMAAAAYADVAAKWDLAENLWRWPAAWEELAGAARDRPQGAGLVAAP